MEQPGKKAESPARLIYNRNRGFVIDGAIKALLRSLCRVNSTRPVCSLVESVPGAGGAHIAHCCGTSIASAFAPRGPLTVTVHASTATLARRAPRGLAVRGPQQNQTRVPEHRGKPADAEDPA